jgi:parvulin-like peptidyl-prolyl isomerase
MSFIALSKRCALVGVCLHAAGCVVTAHGGPGQVPDVPPAPLPALSTPRPLAKAAAKDPPQEIRASHILVAFQGKNSNRPVTRTREEALARIQEAIERLEAGEPFESVASEYSDDPSAQSNHGDLGRFSADKMVPAFSEAAFALAPGELSAVIETAFGYHVIQRTE